MDDNFPYNAGIMLMNMGYMRKTNQAFIDWIFAQKNGLYYEGGHKHRAVRQICPRAVKLSCILIVQHANTYRLWRC